MTASITIIEDFYPDPDQVRRQALSYQFDFTGRYPGRRSAPFHSNQLRRTFEDILKLSIAAEPVENFRSQFQIATAADRSWIYADRSTNYAGVIYLTPNAPAGCGTSFYRHRASGLYRFDPAQGEMLDREGSDDSKWEETDRIANRYNRLILYDGKLFHRSTGYFGAGLQDGRLFQVFFFNAEKA